MRTIAQALAANMAEYDRFPICCPFNVSQIGREGVWIATMPDRSVLFCDYQNRKTACNVIENHFDNAWDIMNEILSKYSGEEIK